MVYIDTNMVRAGVVSHPSMWAFCGYNEIQQPRRKNVLIDYRRLQELLGAVSYDQMKERHQGWVAEYCGGEEKARKDDWTGSIAVGSEGFVERVKELLGIRAKGREVVNDGEGCRVREGAAIYIPFFGAEKEEIGSENTYF
jgi:putative transposase